MKNAFILVPLENSRKQLNIFEVFVLIIHNRQYSPNKRNEFIRRKNCSTYRTNADDTCTAAFHFFLLDCI